MPEHIFLQILAIDVVRIVHLVAIAVGLGTMVSTDINTFRRVGRPITAEFLGAVEGAHRIMMPALMVAWVSGICLIYARTGFELASFSPKLWVKLMVVGVLTVTAVLVKWRVMPILEGARGDTLMEVRLDDKIVLALCAALSMSGWTSALILGASVAVKSAGWSFLVGVMLLIYAFALGMALVVAHRLDARVQRAIARADRIAAE
ncbi:MAG: hypothetical protein AAGI70_02040 [Pseudomonadota bacterium]